MFLQSHLSLTFSNDYECCCYMATLFWRLELLELSVARFPCLFHFHIAKPYSSQVISYSLTCVAICCILLFSCHIFRPISSEPTCEITPSMLLYCINIMWHLRYWSVVRYSISCLGAVSNIVIGPIFPLVGAAEMPILVIKFTFL